MNTYYVKQNNTIFTIEADYIYQVEGEPLRFMLNKQEKFGQSVAQFFSWEMWCRKGHLISDRL